MGMECSECERDLRAGHDPSCSRYKPEQAHRCPSCAGKGADDYGTCLQCGGSGRVDRDGFPVLD
jgi:DnaJ-class molecular chaperone